jgi:hypothetical protein
VCVCVCVCVRRRLLHACSEISGGAVAEALEAHCPAYAPDQTATETADAAAAHAHAHANHHADAARSTGTAQSADEWLFRRLSEAITKGFPEGALYKSGKHVIFSNPNRNQAPISLCNYLLRLGCVEAASAISSLISHTEARYTKHVAAVQINVSVTIAPHMCVIGFINTLIVNLTPRMACPAPPTAFWPLRNAGAPGRLVLPQAAPRHLLAGAAGRRRARLHVLLQPDGRHGLLHRRLEPSRDAQGGAMQAAPSLWRRLHRLPEEAVAALGRHHVL